MKETPLLISSNLLRKLGAGQIDISTISKEGIQIIEEKHSKMLSHKQYKKLRKSSLLLASIFELPIKLTLCAK